MELEFITYAEFSTLLILTNIVQISQRLMFRRQCRYTKDAFKHNKLCVETMTLKH